MEMNMKFNFMTFFREYEVLVGQIDELYIKMKDRFDDLIMCKKGCSDCCHALFDVTLIEAIYLNYYFYKIVNDNKKNKILEVSNIVDRKIHRIKRKIQKDVISGEKSSEQVLNEVGIARIRCPVLNDNNLCDIYEYRPITCRAYGIPISIAGESHTCGSSGFDKGSLYPTMKLDIIHQKLHLISEKLVAGIRTRYLGIAEFLMPVSMALLTKFDEEYFGIKNLER